MSDILPALAALQKGRPIIIIDEKSRENEGDLVASCQTLTDGCLNFMVKHSSGIICMATTPNQLQKLGLEQLKSNKHQRDQQNTAFANTFEAKDGITTGISAIDRAHSLRIAAHPDAQAEHIVSPGHVLTLQAHPLGLNARQGHTEASVEICKQAGLLPSAALVEVPDENGGMMRPKQLEKFAQTYDIPMLTIADIKQHANQSQANVQLIQSCQLPTEYGLFTLSLWQDPTNKDEHISLTQGHVKDQHDVLVRIHSQCLTGDVFHSLKCDCRSQLEYAFSRIQQQKNGVFLWMRQEGRGIGLINKIKAYHLQDQGLDTITANTELGLPIDCRDYKAAAEILQKLGIQSIQLMTNNPHKIQALEDAYPNAVHPIEVPPRITPENKDYLNIKNNKMGHKLKGL